MEKPFAESCAENQLPILEQLRTLFADRKHVLELGSGTGQHAVFFAQALAHLHWQTSDVEDNHWGIKLWLSESGLLNVAPPLALDVISDPWPEARFDAAFSANTVHIMGWTEVEALFRGLGRVLVSGAVFALYGPFNENGQFSSQSNARFDEWLKERNPKSGIRDKADLQALGNECGLILDQDIEMPVNNRILVWRHV